jgi:chromate reductase, NAD(P)H dehydrogenase (quinone)
VKILAIAGSLRVASFNRKLLAVAIKEVEKGGAEVDLYDLKEPGLPIYDQDIEDRGFPAEALKLKERIARADGLLISTPEYNNNLPAGLKNAIDWASRPLPKVDGKPHLLTQPFKGKLAALLGATPGMGGTLYAQLALRQVMSTLGVWTLPGSVTLSAANSAFDEQGQLKDEAKLKQLVGYLGIFVEELRR